MKTPKKRRTEATILGIEAAHVVGGRAVTPGPRALALLDNAEDKKHKAKVDAKLNEERAGFETQINMLAANKRELETLVARWKDTARVTSKRAELLAISGRRGDPTPISEVEVRIMLKIEDDAAAAAVVAAAAAAALAASAATALGET